MSQDKKNNNSGKGFASMSQEKQDAARRKSVETRRRNREEKEKKVKLAKEKRTKAESLIKQAEMLQQEADELDGQCSSEKYRKKREAELIQSIEERFRDSVSPQYLKMMKQHAILRGLSVDELVTPSHAAMDILHDPNASAKEKQDAMKALQQFENAKPQAKQDEDGDAIGSAQEEFNKLIDKVDMIAPKR